MKRIAASALVTVMTIFLWSPSGLPASEHAQRAPSASGSAGQIELSEGWNLISLPSPLQDPSPA